MTLLDRCKHVHAQIERRNVLRIAHKDAEAFRQRAGELRALCGQVELELGKLTVLQKNGVILTKLPTPMAAIGVLRECESGLAVNPTESGKDYGRLKRSIDKVSKDLASLVDKALDAVNRDLPSIEESFLRQVELIPTYTTRVTRIREERVRLLKGKDLRSMIAEDLQEFLNRRNALRTLADQLKPDEFPKEVLEFFKAARQGGAPLDKFTTTVREWLAERDQIKNVRVIIR
jgi:hypothetical protein